MSVPSSVNKGCVYYQKVENEKIISQIVGISEVLGQNADRVSKNDKSCHIFSIRLKGVFA